MAIARVTVPASTLPTHVEFWVCRLCGRDASLVDNTGSALASIEYFLEQMGWRHLPDGDVVCDRCKVLPEIAHIILAHEKVHTQ